MNKSSWNIVRLHRDSYNTPLSEAKTHHTPLHQKNQSISLGAPERRASEPNCRPTAEQYGPTHRTTTTRAQYLAAASRPLPKADTGGNDDSKRLYMANSAPRE